MNVIKCVDIVATKFNVVAFTVSEITVCKFVEVEKGDCCPTDGPTGFLAAIITCLFD